MQELAFLVLGLICTIVSWIKLRPMYAAWMTGNWILFASVNYFRSIPRYTLTMFPIFILFGLLSQNRFWAGVLTVWSLLFFALFAVLFARGEWAFYRGPLPLRLARKDLSAASHCFFGNFLATRFTSAVSMMAR